MKTFLILLCTLCASAVTSSAQLYFSPDEDTQTAVLAFVQSATKKIRIADYGFVCPPLTDLLIAKRQAGVDVQCVFDKVQASGHAEVVELAKLKAAGVPFLTGTSQKHHIMHLKVIIVDDAAVLSGSYNLTTTAALENNTFDIIRDPARAARFTAIWNELWQWMTSEAAK